MKKFSKINENKSMAYADFFGNEISHEKAIYDKVRGILMDIILEERKISEKSFNLVDDVSKELKIIMDKNPEIVERANQYYQCGKRLKLLGEELYQELIKNPL